eukprot:scaffold276226_cov30-Tisochrysis_lutea.AAC.1
MRWILKLSEYRFDVVHKPGKDHCDADGLSRIVALPQPHGDDLSTTVSAYPDTDMSDSDSDDRQDAVTVAT